MIRKKERKKKRKKEKEKINVNKNEKKDMKTQGNKLRTKLFTNTKRTFLKRKKNENMIKGGELSKIKTERME